MKLISTISIAAILFFSFTLNAQVSVASRGLKSNQYTMKTTIDKTGKSIATTNIEYVVESEVGRTNLTNYRIHFSGEKNNFKLLDTYSETAGKKTSVNPKAVVVIDHQTQQEGLSDYKQVIIPISDITIGSRVVISYQVTTPAIITGHLSETLVLTNETLAKIEHYTFESEIPLKVVTKGMQPNFAENQRIEKNAEGKPVKYILELKPTAIGYATEGQPSENGIAFISTSPDWQSIRENFSAKYKKIWEEKLPPALAAIAEKTKKLKTVEEQIEFASQELSKTIAYSGNWTTNNGKFIPQNFTSLVKIKRGDCKDYSSALVAILRQVGFEAYPALTFRSQQHVGREFLEKISDLPNIGSFNHAIVWAQDKDKNVWWIDPTNPLVIAGVVSSDILGNFALVLDNKSQNVTFLPETNSTPNDSTIEYTIKINPDNSVEARGKMLLNGVSYNSIGLIEKSLGLDGVKNVLNYIFNPLAKIDMNIKKIETEKIPNYDFQFISKNLIHEEENKYKFLMLPHSSFMQKQMISANKDSYIGEVGTVKMITKIEKNKAVETFSEDCFARTPWIDADRIVEDKDDHILVTDIVKTKVRTITKSQASEKDFNEKISSLENCASKFRITLFLSPEVKTPEKIKEDTDLGPDVYTMTEENAKKIRDLRGPEYAYKGPKKLYKYYTLKLKADPTNTEYLARKAQSIVSQGYLYGDKYDQEFLQEAIGLVNKAHDLNQKKYNKLVFINRININILMGNFKEASEDLKMMFNFEKTDRYIVYSLSAELASAQKSFELAEQWVRASEKLVKTSQEKDVFYSNIYNVLLSQKKYDEAIQFQEQRVKSDPQNAWNYHNLAILYKYQKKYEKVVEYENKALSLSNFGAAKKVLSDAYLAQAKELKPSAAGSSREPSSVSEKKSSPSLRFDKEKYENLLLKSINADSENKDCLIELTSFYTTEMLQTKEWQEPQKKAELYLNKLKEIDPRNPILPGLAMFLQVNKKILEKTNKKPI